MIVRAIDFEELARNIKARTAQRKPRGPTAADIRKAEARRRLELLRDEQQTARECAEIWE